MQKTASQSDVKSIISRFTKDATKEPLFFGAPLGMQRFDEFKYPQIDEFFNKQMLFFWRPEEISLQKDRSDFNSLSEHEKFIFTKNLGYQILLDSIQSRGIGHLAEHCSNTETEAFLGIWAFFEGIHSRSYTYIIKNVYPDPSKVLDALAQDEAILNRALGVTKYYDDMINAIDTESEYNKKKQLYLTLMSIQILEAVRFYVSFACSYYFSEQGKMTGNAAIIELINRDENLHLGFTNFMLKVLKNEDEGFADVIKDCEPLVIQMWKDAAEEEIAWAEYLFKDGDLIGLNAEILTMYMKYLVNLRMKTCGLPKIFENTKNPIMWIQKYTNSSAVQTAPQEKESTSYLSNSVASDKMDFSGDDFTL